MVAMADVTIYSMECNFCEDDYETIDYLVGKIKRTNGECLCLYNVVIVISNIR